MLMAGACLLLLRGASAAGVLVIGVRHRRAGVQELTELVERVSDPKSPEFGQYLSASAAIALVRPSDEALAEAKQWAAKSKLCLPGTMREELSMDTLRCDLAASPAPSQLRAMGRPDSVEFVVATSLSRSARGAPAYSASEQALTWRKKAATIDPGLHGTPIRQRAAYGIPESERGTNASNLQMVRKVDRLSDFSYIASFTPSVGLGAGYIRHESC